MIRYYTDDQIHPWSEYSDKTPKAPADLSLLDAQIYSAYSPALDPFNAQCAAERERAALGYSSPNHLACRDDYPPIPGLTVRGMIRSSWINMYTGEIETIKSIGFDQWGKPHPNFTGIMGDVCLWWNGRPVIEHWTYIDHAMPVTIAHWALHHMQYTAEQLARAISEAARDKSSYRKQEVATRQRCFDNAKVACMLWVNRKVIDTSTIAQIEATALGRGVQMGLF